MLFGRQPGTPKIRQFLLTKQLLPGVYFISSFVYSNATGAKGD